MAIEKITGASFASVLEARILGPLNLTGTTYPTQVALPDPHPTPYEVDLATGALEVLPLVNPTSLSAAGAMVSTLDDLQTWGRALGDGRLIGAELQAQRIARSRAVTNGPTYDRYGLGIGILVAGGATREPRWAGRRQRSTTRARRRPWRSPLTPPRPRMRAI